MIIPVQNLVLLPGMTSTLRLNTRFSLPENADGEPFVALPARRGKEDGPLTADDFYKIGVSVEIQKREADENGLRVSVKVVSRVAVSDLAIGAASIQGTVTPLPDVIDLDENSRKEMIAYIQNISHQVGAKFQNSEKIVQAIDEIDDLNVLIGSLCHLIPLTTEEQYALMETSSLKTRGLTFIDYFLHYKESIQLQIEMSERFNEKASKNYRESVLREQLKAIQEELGQKDAAAGEPGEKDYRALIEKSGMPDEIRKAALEQAGKLEQQNPASPDYNILRDYLDLLVALPWKVEKAEPVSLQAARSILDAQHYGLKKVKERILQHIAVMQLKENRQGSILLLVGPPGTGKTSLGRSIAEALGRKYIRLSLGGTRDEAEIRGHRRTYIGAMPGRIIEGIKTAGTMNPVMVLDEVDKLMTGYNGDPAAALLEVLDPEQNNTFTDHYLDLPYDLSNVFFIATANTLETIPTPLLDRMEVIELSSYTSDEKFHIGRDHLIPEVLKDNGLTGDDVTVGEETLKRIISDFTMEAGVRGLKRQLNVIARTVAEKIVSGTAEKPFVVRPEDLGDILGRRAYHHDIAQKISSPGVVTGLAWTQVGGEILFIEATDMPGQNQMILTGQLGDVMKESARISLSLLKSRLPVNAIQFKDRDLHIHIPSGAVPKDGPSAGITLFTALASLFTGIPVDPHLAMTGEVTLRGAVLPIGGLKEKLLAADRAGITRVLIPKDNVEDLKDIPKEVLERIQITPVETVEDVLRETLGITLPRTEQVLLSPDFLNGLVTAGASDAKVQAGR